MMPSTLGCNKDKSGLYRQVARIHAQHIDQGFLATMGERFLTLLYEAIDSDETSALLVEQVDGEVVGFVAGGCGMGPIYRQMLQRWPRLAWALLPALIDPAKLKRILEIVWLSKKGSPVPGCPKAELFSIAVADSARGQGVAQRLYRAIALRLGQNGEPAFCIVVGDDLHRAQAFYKRMGAVPMAHVTVHRGKGSTLYRQDIPLTV